MKYLLALENLPHGRAPQGARPAAVRSPNGKRSVTDGPYVETKELLGGRLGEAADRDVSRSPGAQSGAVGGLHR
jgi:hypothetical protein